MPPDPGHQAQRVIAINRANFSGNRGHPPHFAEKETEAQRGKTIWPKIAEQAKHRGRVWTQGFI